MYQVDRSCCHGSGVVDHVMLSGLLILHEGKTERTQQCKDAGMAGTCSLNEQLQEVQAPVLAKVITSGAP